MTDHQPCTNTACHGDLLIGVSQNLATLTTHVDYMRQDIADIKQRVSAIDARPLLSPEAAQFAEAGANRESDRRETRLATHRSRLSALWGMPLQLFISLATLLLAGSGISAHILSMFHRH